MRRDCQHQRQELHHNLVAEARSSAALAPYYVAQARDAALQPSQSAGQLHSAEQALLSGAQASLICDLNPAKAQHGGERTLSGSSGVGSELGQWLASRNSGLGRLSQDGACRDSISLLEF